MKDVKVGICHELFGAAIAFGMGIFGGGVLQHFVIRVMGHLGFVAVFDSVENPDKGQLVIKIAEFDFSSGNSADSFWLVLVGYALNSIVHCKSGAGEFAASEVFSPHCLKRDFAFLCEVFFPKFVY